MMEPISIGPNRHNGPVTTIMVAHQLHLSRFLTCLTLAAAAVAPFGRRQWGGAAAAVAVAG
jgi:hypothetical protein